MTSGEEYVSAVWRPGIFDGKVVFCTGGSGDICSAQTRALVSLGANACIIGRNQEKAERKASEIATARPGSKVLGYGNIDVRSIKDLENAASKCVQELGRIDFVIVGAAGNFLSPFLQLSPKGFATVVDIDLKGAYNTAKATVPYLLESVARNPGAGGRIIFISSTGHYVGTHLNTHAVAAKAGVDALSAQLAIELGPRGITSNVVTPGGISGTEGVKRLIETRATPDSYRKIPLGRLGSLKDISDAIVYLFSEAGDYVNGAVLVVDGGAWRMGGGGIGSEFDYPDSVLSEQPFREIIAQGSKL